MNGQNKKKKKKDPLDKEYKGQNCITYSLM